MNQKIVEVVLEALKSKLESKDDKCIMFSNPDYKAIEFSDDKFHEIDGVGGKVVGFVDGGNLEILKAPNFSLQFMRIASIIYKDNNIIKKQVREYYILVTAIAKDDEIHYKCQVFPFDEGLGKDWNFFFNSTDNDIGQKNFRASISSIGGIVRNIFEIKEAERMLDEVDIIVRDGNLQATNQLEEDFFDLLFGKAKAEGKTVCGFAKTSDLLTDAGNSASDYFSRHGSLGEWYYYPVVEIKSSRHKADVYFTRLHASAKYVFRMDVCNVIPYDIGEVLSSLKYYSSDPVFFGYPYPLIKVDGFARVSIREAEFIRMKIVSKLGKDYKDIEGALNSLNSHSILDNI